MGERVKRKCLRNANEWTKFSGSDRRELLIQIGLGRECRIHFHNVGQPHYSGDRDAWRKVFPCDDQFRYLKNCTNWLEIGIWLVRKVGVKRERERVGSCVTHQDGIAVGSCAHCAGRARRTAGPSDILNDELLPEQPRHVLADDASTNVSCPASSDWHDDRHCPP